MLASSMWYSRRGSVNLNAGPEDPMVGCGGFVCVSFGVCFGFGLCVLFWFFFFKYTTTALSI